MTLSFYYYIYLFCTEFTWSNIYSMHIIYSYKKNNDIFVQVTIGRNINISLDHHVIYTGARMYLEIVIPSVAVGLATLVTVFVAYVCIRASRQSMPRSRAFLEMNQQQ